jgi:biotin carboxyl carrier protein
MSIYYVTIGKNEYQIEIDDSDYKINGEAVEATLTALKERGVYVLKKGLWKREFHVEAEGKGQYMLDSEGLHGVAKVEKSSPSQRQTATMGTGDLVSPMPCQVVSVSVHVGDPVEKGHLLLVVESMKMQMTLYAPCVGKVTQVNAQPGMLIAKGDTLVKIEGC